MITIQELINKIKWDDREDPSEYSLSYIDRITLKLIPVKYTDILRVEEGFMVLMKKGEETHIPLHRIREVRKKEVVIWQRRQ
ncbi:DUF504 domain-containing protein [Candidatus Woesearchaeota archaeon]|nr:DUF504 domain-containing protein [Candidatus Woesearchaeota archaeon]